MSRVLRRVESIAPRRAAEFGGKARNLAVLARAGFPVPAAWAMPASACEAFVDGILPVEDRLPALLSERPGTLEASRLEAIGERLRRAPLPAALDRAVRDAFASLLREGATAIAVRSSSTSEDQDAASAAGMHETRLNVTTAEAALDAVRDCWASLFAPRAVAYLRSVGSPSETGVGIVLQAMVPADVAGVLFTVNPLTGDAGEMVINAAYGLGSTVVDGRVSPDTLRIDKATGAPRDRILGDKALQDVVVDGGGVAEREVPQEQRERLALDDEAVAQLVALGLRIEEHFDDARDVEWALLGKQVYALQARPVTTSIQGSTRKWQRRRGDRHDRAKIVWSNVNVGEALPGVPTPLTWSILSAFSELGFRRAFGSLGCTVPGDAELVGSFRGRIYLNLTEFMGILSQVPGLRPKLLLSLGGGGEVDAIEASIQRRSSRSFLARLPLTVARFTRENFQLSARVEDFAELFAAERRRLRSIDTRVLPPAALDHALHDVERLLDQSGAVMLTAYGNLLSSVVVLAGVLRVVGGQDADALQRDLLTGLADLDSAAPGLALWHIAEMARGDAPAREAILAGEAGTMALEDLPDGPTQRALERFFEAYGHRGAREAEIAELRWREDPTLLFVSLQLHLRRGGGGERPIDVERRQRKVREDAEARLERRLPLPARSALRHLLFQVQRLMRLREQLRGYVTEVLGMFRTVALDASRRLERREPAAGPDAAFFLTLDELHSALRGETTHVAAQIRLRRRQFERDRALPNPEDTFVGYPAPVPEALPDTDSLRGLAASGGRVEGKARVVFEPADAALLEDGEILVAACADVGWSPLFLVAKAVVTDLGGPLSHAAIVLREYGVPAVVNVKVGTRLIKTGDRLLVDGDMGVVRIQPPAS